MPTEMVEKRSGVSRSWLVVGGLIAAVSIVVGGVAVHDALSRLSGPNTERQQQVYRNAITRIDVNLAAGTFTIRSGAVGEVSLSRVLKWDQTKPTITETVDGNTLRISEICEDTHRCSTDYTVTVPESVAVQAHVFAGDLAIRDNAGDLDLVVDAGRVTLGNVSGKVHVRTNAGEVRGDGIRSPAVDVKSGSGVISLAFATAPNTVDASADVGDIKIRVPNTAPGSGGYHVQADTTVGNHNVNVNQEQNVTRSIVVHSSIGNVSVDYS